MSDSTSSNGDSDIGVGLDDEEEAQLKQKLSTLNQKLREQPNAYDLHVERITTLRLLGDLDELRMAREEMHTIYPLSAQLWLDWIDDEKKIAVTDEEKRKIQCLFLRAIEDYDDVPIWLEYCLFMIGSLQPGADSDHLVDTQHVFESALSHQGLNVAAGATLWGVYRDFQTILLEYTSLDTSKPKDDIIKQIDRLYKRQLRIPLMSMQSTMESYEEFLKTSAGYLTTTEVSPECQKEYDHALRQLDLILPFEDKLEESAPVEANLLSAWEIYLDWAMAYPPHSDHEVKAKRGAYATTDQPFSPNHICCLFERAITALCLHPTIWLKFVNYLEDKLSSDRQRLLQVLARAVRNCPWSAELWMRYAVISELWAVEQLTQGGTNGVTSSTDYSVENQAFLKVEAVYEAALSAGLSEQLDLSRIWLGYCDYRLRRLLRLQPPGDQWDLALTILRSLFDRAHAELGHAFRNSADPDGIFSQYQALIEAKYASDLGRARSVWSDLMQRPGCGAQPRFWLAYLQFERNWGDAKHFLRIARMAINSIVGEDAVSSFDCIQRMACEFGLNIEQLHELQLRIRRRSKELEQRNTDKMVKTPTASDGKTKDSSQTMKSTKTQKPNKRVASTAEHGSGAPKKQKVERVANLSSETSQGERASSIATTKGHGEFFEHNPHKDARTVFVSNLDYSATEEQLRQTFQSCGSISSVRLVRDYAGRSKGFAYVEFSDIGTSVEQALGMDRQPVFQSKPDPNTSFARPMFVSRCDPSRSSAAAFQYTVGKAEPEKLFVRNLDKRVSKQSLQELFGQHGTVISVRLATYRNGSPKGHAYIEFSNADEASRALIATDGLKVGEKNISVSISNPPVRNPSQYNPKSDDIGSTGNRIPALHARTHARQQLSFIPRALNRTVAPQQSNTVNADPIETASQISTQSKTNEDFRKMFLS